jgi:hypothetical protein
MCRTSAYIYRSFFQLIVQWWRKQVFKPFLTNKKLSIIGQDFENFYRDIFMNNSDKSYSEIWSPVCLCLNIIVFLINLKHHDFSIENWFETKKKKFKNFIFSKTLLKRKNKQVRCVWYCSNCCGCGLKKVVFIKSTFNWGWFGKIYVWLKPWLKLRLNKN